MAGSDSTDTVSDDVKRSRVAMVLKLTGLGDIAIGIAAVFAGPTLVPGLDEVWVIVGVALAVAGLVVILIGRRLDPASRAR